MINIFKSGFILLTSLVLIVGCSSTSKGSSGGSKSGGNSLIDVLTEFSVAVNENDFKRAISFLKEDEKARILGASGKISKKVKRQLKALKVHRLIKNPRVRLEGGKIAGIYNSLPNLDHGASLAPASGVVIDPSVLKDLDNAAGGTSNSTSPEVEGGATDEKEKESAPVFPQSETALTDDAGSGSSQPIVPTEEVAPVVEPAPDVEKVVPVEEPAPVVEKVAPVEEPEPAPVVEEEPVPELTDADLATDEPEAPAEEAPAPEAPAEESAEDDPLFLE